jgi:hypothetical protein
MKRDGLVRLEYGGIAVVDLEALQRGAECSQRWRE